MKKNKLEMRWKLLIIINILGFWTIIIPIITLCWLLCEWKKLDDSQ